MTMRICVLAICAMSICGRVVADDWPQFMGPQRDGVWREEGIVERFPAGGPKVLWRTPVAAGYAGPAVAGGRVYVMDRIVADDAQVPGSVWKQGDIGGFERIICLDEKTGKILWKEQYACNYTCSYAAGPRATPIVRDGRVYTMGTEGHVQCRDVASGKLIWAARLGDEDGKRTPTWGNSAAPVLEGDKLICMQLSKKGVVIAFNKDTGKPAWTAIKAREPGYCAPAIIDAGGRRQLVVWHPQALVSLNPDNGEVYWQDEFPVQYGVTVATPRKAGDLLFVGSANEGIRMYRLAADRPAATLLWKRGGNSETRTDAIHSLMCTPVYADGYIYGVCAYGQLRCIRADDGRRVWETMAATTGAKPAWCANAFIIPHKDRYFLANEKGDLIIARLSPRGYDEISRAHLLEPTNRDAGRAVVWSPPAFADRCVYMRNDREIICVSLAEVR